MDSLHSKVTVNELLQMCKIVTSTDAKQLLLTQVAEKLTTENFNSFDERLRQEILDICSEIYNEKMINMFRWAFDLPVIPCTDITGVLEPLNQSVQNSTLRSEEGGGNFKNSKELVRTIPILRKRGLYEETGQDEPQPGTSCSRRSEPMEEAEKEDEVETKETLGRNRLVNILVLSHRSIFNNKFKCQCAETVFKFKNIPQEISHLPKFLNDAFTEILSFLTKDALPHHKIGMKFFLTNFNATAPIGINFTNVSELKSDAIGSILESVAQSNSNFLLTDRLEISSVILQVSHGKGRINMKRITNEEILKRKTKSVVEIKVDNPIYCLPVAILVGKCLVNKDNRKIRSYRRSTRILMKDVHSLNKKAKVKTDINFGTTVTQISDYQKALPGYNIVVFNDTQDFKSKLYKINDGNNTDGKDINIFYFESISHFAAIKNVRCFFGKRYQCEICFELYNYKNMHLCPEKCRSCESSPLCPIFPFKIKCNTCNRYFNGRRCYNAHKKTICSILIFCQVCTKLIDLRKRNYKAHSCNEKICSICLKIVDCAHQCYVQKYKKHTPVNFSIIFFDLKCTQNLDIENKTFLHVPNLCVAHIVCKKCFMIPHTKVCCAVCGKRQHIFENSADENCVKKFIDFCELYRRGSLNIFCIAHNFYGYDGQFILTELAKRKKTIKPIMGGMKIYKIVYDSYITFIDSLNFLPMPLSKFSEMFGLKNVAKGWYPHFFNTSENYDYIGDVPDRKYFGTDHMTEKEVNRFNCWYEERISSGVQYDNRKELIQYCTQDVDILRNGCVAFMTNFCSITSINPLLESFTLAQTVMHAFRKKFLKENTLGIVPANLYHESRKHQSSIGLKWLVFQNKKCMGKIVYEVKIPTTNYYVDGYCKDTNTVYEFLGCYWHGCTTCFLNRSHCLNGSVRDTFDTRYNQTCLRLNFLVSQGYKIKRVWECKFIEFLIKNPRIVDSLENDPQIVHSYLNPRDAIYGGRTETFQLHYKVKLGEKIRYYEFTSLYPFVNKTGKNPINHPKVYYKDDCKNLDVSNMDGLIKCSILPPIDLLIPVLPCKINKKLLFVLCRTCAEKENVTTTCSHKESERMLTGTWVLDEVKLAVANNYKICEIFEVWEYEISQYNADEKTGGVFTEYMNCFLKLKQEASDWPANVTTETEKEVYIKEFFSHEGINLDSTAIKNNPSQRGCSKLALNVLWGKFIQRNDRSQTSIIHSISELNILISSPGVIITDVVPVENFLWINWKYSNEEFSEQLKHVSLSIGAFTTANARIKLYSELSKITQNILYCDTDSIIFVENDSNRDVLKTGNFIGDLTDELSAYGKNAYITEFASTGPKCYGYIVFDPDKNEYFEIAKCKGITLNIESKKVLNFSTLKSMVVNDDDEGFRLVYDANKIKRKKMLKVVSEEILKTFGFTFTKRICLGDLKTVPYGFNFL